MSISQTAADVMALAQDGEVEAALAAADTALDAACSAPPAELAALWYAIAVTEHVRGDLTGQLSATENCAHYGGLAGQPGWVANALSVRALAQVRAGAVEIALLDIARAEVELSACDDDALRCWAHTGIGYCYEELRLYELAQPHFESAIHLAASPIPLVEAPVIDVLNLAELHLRWADEIEQVAPTDSWYGDVRRHREEAHELAVEAVATGERLGIGPLAARARVVELCSRPPGDAEASVDELRSTYEDPTHVPYQGGRADVGGYLARALSMSGEHEEALAVAREAAELSDDAGDWQVTARARWLLVEMEAEAGLPGAAAGRSYARLLARLLWRQRLSTLQGATAALDVARLQHETEVARRAAIEDPLTGVGNRRALDEALQVLAGEPRSRWANGTATLLLVDLDEFKAVNDGYGHVMGDEVLRAVARAVQGVARSDDLVARLGGDEFVVLARDTDAEGGSRLATRVEDAIGAIVLPTPTGHLRLTASIGVASTSVDVGPETLLQLADDAMYDDKARGRHERRGASA